ncbi:hypothetical protein F4818DRAFT_441097 [Hypoxylon cercidicola]|nr:hypothetical protein F4818DRAFT_441097 [Hypoxylon cercidicola]
MAHRAPWWAIMQRLAEALYARGLVDEPQTQVWLSYKVAAGTLGFPRVLAIASSCPNVSTSLYPFEVAKGWTAVKVAGGLQTPRGMVFDSAGRLLIVQNGKGISQHTVDMNGCITSSRFLISIPTLNHGIYFSVDGNTLYASSDSFVYRWSYDSRNGSVSQTSDTVVSGMAYNGHVTRTLIIPPNHPDLLVVSHGSNGNLDDASADPAIARAIVKVFNTSTIPSGGYNYAKDGWNAGYGLRNEVGLAFDGNNFLWGVENSADELSRTVDGASTDIHTDNPAEELNFLGDVAIPNNQWYGYPTCFTIWQPSSDITITDSDTDTVRELGVGQQFVQAPNATFDDANCTRASVPPLLTFEAHTAPLDAKFDRLYTNLYVTLHGSWNRAPPAGYKLVAVPFTRHGDTGDYTPAAAPDSKEGYTDIFYPPNEGNCSSTTCVRPVGLVFDAAGRLYMSSDTSGEVFMLSNGQGSFNGTYEAKKACSRRDLALLSHASRYRLREIHFDDE